MNNFQMELVPKHAGKKYLSKEIHHIVAVVTSDLSHDFLIALTQKKLGITFQLNGLDYTIKQRNTSPCL